MPQLRLVQVPGGEPVAAKDHLPIERAPLAFVGAGHVRDDHMRMQVRVLRPARPVPERCSNKPAAVLADSPAAAAAHDAPQQFNSEWNVEENRTWLGAEILRQLPPGVTPDALVVGVGTGGTLIGVGQAFREVNPETRLVAVEPDESCTILCGEIGKHAIEGISDGFVPGIVARHRALIDEIVPVTGPEALAEMRRLATSYGMFVGPSSGAHLVVARQYAADNPQLANVVTLLCDEGEKYLSEHFA